MDLKNMGALVAGLVVSVILLAAVLVPVISEATETETTFTNSGGFYPMEEISATDDGTYTLEWEKTNTTVLTINGVEFDANEAYGVEKTTIMCGEDWLIRYYSAANTYGYCQSFDGTNWRGSDTTKSFSAIASEGTVTVTVVSATDTTTTATYTYEKMYAIAIDPSDDIMKKSVETPYVKGDSTLYAMGVTNGVSGIIRIEGNVDDGVTIDVIGQDSETITNIVIDSEAVNGYLDLYKISKITFDVTLNDTTTACTYNYFIVPYEVTAEKAQHMSSTEIALIELVPLLVTVGIIIGIVGMMFARRE